MPYYRLYCLDGSGKFTKAQDIRADDDHEALAIAREMKLPVKCELWERGRMVATLEDHSKRTPLNGRSGWKADKET